MKSESIRLKRELIFFDFGNFEESKIEVSTFEEKKIPKMEKNEEIKIKEERELKEKNESFFGLMDKYMKKSKGKPFYTPKLSMMNRFESVPSSTPPRPPSIEHKEFTQLNDFEYSNIKLNNQERLIKMLQESSYFEVGDFESYVKWLQKLKRLELT